MKKKSPPEPFTRQWFARQWRENPQWFLTGLTALAAAVFLALSAQPARPAPEEGARITGDHPDRATGWPQTVQCEHGPHGEAICYYEYGDERAAPIADTLPNRP